MLAEAERSLIIVVDIQPPFLKVIHEGERVLDRSKFLVESAHAFEIPVLATIQNPARMGGTEENLHQLIRGKTFEKMAFSCCGASGLMEEIRSQDKSQIILVGIETHICVNQTALDLLHDGYDVFLALDAVSSRSQSSTDIGVMRMRDAGVHVCHTESLVYEWLRSAEHPDFKNVLPVVKKYT